MVTKEQEQMFAERVSSWKPEEQKNWHRLCDLLLPLGGKAVVARFSYDEDTLKIMAGKQTFIIGQNSELTYKLGKPSQCHQNVIDLWKAKHIQHIYTGYGLSEDGLWREHSWGLDITYANDDSPPVNVVVETTEERLIYFGYEVV